LVLSIFWGRTRCLVATPHVDSGENYTAFSSDEFFKIPSCRGAEIPRRSSPSSEQLNTITTLLQAAKEIKDLVVLSNTRFAVRATRGFVSGRSTRDDLLIIGLETLMTCTGGFDCSKGFRFSTYAGVALRGAYIRAVTVSNTRELASLTNEEFRQDPSDVRENATLSGANHTYLREELSAALAKLSPRGQVVLTHRILKEETLQAVGERIGMTKEGTRLAVLKALKNLRKVMRFDPRDDFL
jgi:RNA polymerase sigma factor (sigma-70 family)